MNKEYMNKRIGLALSAVEGKKENMIFFKLIIIQ